MSFAEKESEDEAEGAEGLSYGEAVAEEGGEQREGGLGGVGTGDSSVAREVISA